MQRARPIQRVVRPVSQEFLDQLAASKARQIEVEAHNQVFREQTAAIENLLSDVVTKDWALEFGNLEQFIESRRFNKTGNPTSISALPTAPMPSEAEFLTPPTLIQRLIGGQGLRDRMDAAERRYKDSMKSVEDYNRRTAKTHASEIAAFADRVATLRRGYEAGEQQSAVSYFQLVFDQYDPAPVFPDRVRVAYVPLGRKLVLEIELPKPDDILRFQVAGMIDKPPPAAKLKALYELTIAKLALAPFHVAFSADRGRIVDEVVVSGFLRRINPATGQPDHPCIFTVTVDRARFEAIDLRRVDPAACLASFHVRMARNLTGEIKPVAPILSFDMVDRRFIDATDVLSSLDERPNLMDLTPSEFENLITNLFEKMGLETRLTQASRDGGVDCVAFDTRPILGGKVVIQAKRYKRTVGVSAVRDLYGTVQNERASKGILVTTSGYGKASRDFADGKPLELITGAGLLSLLQEFAETEAKIIFPDDWVDPLATDEEP